ncbi:MAG: glycosyltransferase family 2 protein [Saprospiraceae bacterium]|nr:glycosyltransferase family 2 protein [Saprospiraceae bacterium]
MDRNVTMTNLPFIFASTQSVRFIVLNMQQPAADVPLVSVIMPVFNAENFLTIAINSILEQTYSNLELILINDCSTDGSLALMQRYLHDGRVKLFQNPINEGVIASLNKGLAQAQGKYIARMDGDDIAAPKRIAKQVDYLERHPNCFLLGTNMIEFNNQRILRYWTTPKNHAHLAIKKLFNAPFAHPTVMMRRQVFEQIAGYDANYPVVEDYQLWVAIMEAGETANLQEPLLFYRKHADNVSTKKKDVQKASLLRLYQEIWLSQGLVMSQDEALRHYQLCTAQIEDTSRPTDWKYIQNWVSQLHTQGFNSDETPTTRSHRFYFSFYLGALWLRCMYSHYSKWGVVVLRNIKLSLLIKLPIVAVLVWAALQVGKYIWVKLKYKKYIKF